MSGSRRLEGKAALVTGAAGGIGAAIAELFAREGARVLGVDRDYGDVADADTAARAVREAERAFGRLDILVNNAAARDTATLAEADPGDWRRVLDTNLLGCLHFCRAALPLLRAAGRGSVVNVSSCYAVRGRRGFAAYDASKAALLAMTRTLAAEEAAHGVRANAVCPGGTLTPYTVGRGQARGLTEEAMRAQPKADALLGRWAEPMEIAYPVLWLASDEASYVTGAALMVDGGAP